MPLKNTSGTVFIRENTLLPTGLAVETELFLPGWRVVKNLDGYGLGRRSKKRSGTSFIWLAISGQSLLVGKGQERCAK
jgi:hypothetical protein